MGIVHAAQFLQRVPVFDAALRRPDHRLADHDLAQHIITVDHQYIRHVVAPPLRLAPQVFSDRHQAFVTTTIAHAGQMLGVAPIGGNEIDKGEVELFLDPLMVLQFVGELVLGPVGLSLGIAGDRETRCPVGPSPRIESKGRKASTLGGGGGCKIRGA